MGQHPSQTYPNDTLQSRPSKATTAFTVYNSSVGAHLTDLIREMNNSPYMKDLYSKLLKYVDSSTSQYQSSHFG